MHVIGVDRRRREAGHHRLVLAVQPEADRAGRRRFREVASISSANAGVQSITMRSVSSNFRKSEFSTTSLAYFFGEKRPTLILKRMIRKSSSVHASSFAFGVILAVGSRANAMYGKTPEPIELVRPLRDGVIADFIATEEMLRQFIKRAKTMTGFRRPRILICVPAGATPVERRAVYETALSAGARRVYLIEEPVAAALGAGLEIDGPSACMVVDIGGGTADIAVIKNGRVMQGRSVRVAGNAFDEAIMRYVRRRHQLVIGESNAERIKIEAGTAVVQANGRNVEIHIKGRDLREGRLKSVVLGPKEMAEALSGSVAELAEFILRAIEDLPMAMAREVANRGVVLTGGGSLLDKLDVALAERVGVPLCCRRRPCIA